MNTTIVGFQWCPVTYHLKHFLQRNNVPFTHIDAVSRLGRELAERFDCAEDELPLVTFPDGRALRKPDDVDVARAIGINTSPSRKHYDLLVVGAGPGGLAAAIYGASEGLATVVVDADAPGGQAGTTSLIENYFGFPEGVSGTQLVTRSVAQALRLGAELVAPRRVRNLVRDDDGLWHARLDGKGFDLITADSVVLATGVTWRKLPQIPEDHELLGRGVYYGFSMAEAGDCVGQTCIVVGAGNSAGQAAVHLAERGAHVVMLVRGESLRKRMSEYLVRKIEASSDITVRYRTEVYQPVPQEGRLMGVHVDVAGAIKYVPAERLFVMIGGVANTDWLPAAVERDARGFVKAGGGILAHETSMKGLFVVGDVRAESVKRVASAVGEGSVVVSEVHQHLARKEREVVQ